MIPLPEHDGSSMIVLYGAISAEVGSTSKKFMLTACTSRRHQATNVTKLFTPDFSTMLLKILSRLESKSIARIGTESESKLAMCVVLFPGAAHASITPVIEGISRPVKMA